jgi:NAD(P)-dependent dehydrogenase (short-subunit alcohol dehydrogenase family)
MEQRLNGKIAVVTGAARGIGRAYALHLAALGADIVAADIDFAAARAFGEELTADSVDLEVQALGRRAIKVEADLAEPAGAERLINEAIEAFGRVDILVNNAGGNVVQHATSSPSSVPLADHQKLFDLNFMTMLNCCQAVAPASVVDRKRMTSKCWSGRRDR